MKKSKVIIPALGVLILSTAASVTGTVAWFTANRTGTITTGDFAVVKTDGNLQVSCTSGVGTVIQGNTTVNPVTNDTKIGDISFNPSTKQLWNDTGDGTAFREIGDGASYSSLPATGTASHAWKINDKTYHAYTWKVTITFEWGADYTPVNVFFDYNASTMTASSQASGSYETSKGFRMALIGPSNTVVWTKLTNVHRDSAGSGAGQGASDLAAVTGASTWGAYGTTVSNTNFSYFGSDKYAKGNVALASATAVGNYTKATDGLANQNTREDFLGQITHVQAVDTQNSIDVVCVAWYEGTDAAVVDDVDLAKVSSTVGFYAALNQ